MLSKRIKLAFGAAAALSIVGYPLVGIGGTIAVQASHHITSTVQIGGHSVIYHEEPRVANWLRYFPSIGRTGRLEVTIESGRTLETVLTDVDNNGTFECGTVPFKGSVYEVCNGGHVREGNKKLLNEDRASDVKNKFLYWVDWVNDNAPYGSMRSQ